MKTTQWFFVMFVFVMGCTTNQNDDVWAESLVLDSLTQGPDSATEEMSSTTCPATSAEQDAPSTPASAATTIIDLDGDGFAAPEDCCDSDNTVYPGAYELCDHIDNDCNGRTDETWAEIFHQYWGHTCNSSTTSGCVTVGMWDCGDSQDGIVCNAPPRDPTVELCNGIDDDCNGITDTDMWPELHTCCSNTSATSTSAGTWECSPTTVGIMCVSNLKNTAGAACDAE